LRFDVLSEGGLNAVTTAPFEVIHWPVSRRATILPDHKSPVRKPQSETRLPAPLEQGDMPLTTVHQHAPPCSTVSSPP
jgi:hypothetical protein